MRGIELTDHITKVDHREFFNQEGKQQRNHPLTTHSADGL